MVCLFVFITQNPSNNILKQIEALIRGWIRVGCTRHPCTTCLYSFWLLPLTFLAHRAFAGLNDTTHRTLTPLGTLIWFDWSYLFSRTWTSVKRLGVGQGEHQGQLPCHRGRGGLVRCLIGSPLDQYRDFNHLVSSDKWQGKSKALHYTVQCGAGVAAICWSTGYF